MKTCALIFIWIACWFSPADPLKAQQGTTPQYPGLAAPPTTPAGPITVGPVSVQGSSYQGSVPIGRATPDLMPLSLDDAIAQGLRYNLGVITAGYTTRTSQAERLRQLSQLLPNLTTSTSETRETVNLAALGLPANFVPGVPIPSRVGPFNYLQTEGYGTLNALDFTALNNHRAAKENSRAAQFSFRDSQDQVVYTVVNLYLQALTGWSQIVTTQGQVDTSQALYDLAVDQKKVGVVAAIDVLRAHVQLQSDQQNLIFYQNQFEKQKLNIGRAIGLPLGQAISLTEQVPYRPLQGITLGQALEQAYQTRSDYKAALAQVRAAERSKQAAKSERLPSITINASGGGIGTDPSTVLSVFSVAGSLNIPIYLGGRISADIEQADAQLQQLRANAENLRGNIDHDVRTAFLDLRSYEDQLRIAQLQIELAKTQLEQSRDRFAAGVTNNIEVIQSQQSVVTSDNNYISSLYNYNLAKASLARALGLTVEEAKRLVRGGK
jgi:outer membrane protein TolC